MSATGQALIESVGSSLWETAQTSVRQVFDGAKADLPVDAFIRAQEAASAGEYQLPEPLLGPVPDDPIVLVVGENAGYDPANDGAPRLGISKAAYVDWYAAFCSQRNSRGHIVKEVGGRTEEIAHYRHVEELLKLALGDQAMGQAAVYADAIPWKWSRESKSRPRLQDPTIVTYARDRLATIVAALRPRLILSLGDAAGRYLMALPARPQEEPLRSYRYRLGSWECVHFPIPHPANRTGKVTATYRVELSSKIASVLGT